MVAHEDGSIFIYDREKEDQPFIHVNHNQHENPWVTISIAGTPFSLFKPPPFH